MKFFNILPFPELLMHGFRLVPLNSLSISLQGSNYDLTFSTCLPDLFLVYIDRLNQKFIWSVIRYVHVSFNEFLNINFSLFITLYGFCSYIYTVYWILYLYQIPLQKILLKISLECYYLTKILAYFKLS